ncbi:MAG TPA: hypoxanthine phosphoribosyltransferase [Bacteroidia bacterium]|jgi:hypoxanthine phosphoribosyltransferase|nr:hypoxanthine phosphoribosyltransferase [Bacteroidia bacterium]
MSSIQLQDKTFVPYLKEEKILAAVKNIADRINHDLKDKRPLFLVVLNGSFLFAADLLRNVNTDCEVSFMKLASYSGTGSTGTVKELIGLNESVKGRHIVVVEDIVDTGNTIVAIHEQLTKHSPASIHIATLLFKPAVYNKPITIDYRGIEIPNDFIVGYGLDYNGLGRNLRDIYVIKN